MKRLNTKIYREPRPRVFLAQLGELAKKKSLNLFADLQKNGVLVSESFGRGSLKSQLRVANRLGVDVTLIIGQKEALDKTVIVKDMISGTQETVTNEKMVPAVKKILKNNISFVHNQNNNIVEEGDEDEENG
jgi:histidyl-tRNA synthetase